MCTDNYILVQTQHYHLARKPGLACVTEMAIHNVTCYGYTEILFYVSYLYCPYLLQQFKLLGWLFQ